MHKFVQKAWVLFKLYYNCSWIAQSPKEYAYCSQKSGYIDSDLFYDWFVKVFIPRCGATASNHVILIMDNHISHLQARIAQKAIENNISIILEPPYSSHFLQPLDQIFNLLKQGMEEEARLRMLVNCGMEVN